MRKWLRWLIIGGCGAWGMYELATGIRQLSAERDLHWAARWLFLAPVTVIASGIPLGAAYLLIVRQYRRLCTLAAVIAAVAVFLCISAIPDWLGMSDWMDSDQDDARFAAGALANVAAVVCGWYGARWVYGRGSVFLRRHLLPGPQEPSD